jgi:imidazoleglycerol-phosphate dehydratase
MKARTARPPSPEGLRRAGRPKAGDTRKSHRALGLPSEAFAQAGRRAASLHRQTAETDIWARINLDGRGRYKVSTGIRLLDHMLELFARHGGFDLELRARGDLDVDQHHTVEDVGIALGQVVRQALGNKRGINRAGYFLVPMDETLAMAALDLSGRPYLVMKAPIRARRVGDLQTELLEDFFHGLAAGAGASVHLKVAYGRSSHHAVEALFKAFSRALRYACSRDVRLKSQLPSTKGLL